jgi:very-short-patch-repair endonuclease
VTSPARTLIDLAAHLTDRQLEFASDQAITERLVDTRELTRALGLLTRAAGRSRIVALLGDSAHATVTRSRAEERLLAMIRAARLPEPLVNARLAGYEVDFYWPEARLVVEVDGFQFHSTRPRLERDRRKDDALHSLGVSTMRFTWRQLERDAVATLVAIAQALARAGPRSGPH